MSLTHNEIANRWARRGELPREEFRSRNMFCTKETIYSYGYHFPIATWHDERTVFFNADNYSKTTHRHKRIVRWALRHHCKGVTVFELPRALWRNGHALPTLFYMDKIQATVKKWRRARRYKDHHMRDAADYLTEFQRYCAFHKISPTKIIRGDGSFAAACAVIALNPVPETDY